MLAERFELMHRLVGSPPLDLPVENWSDLHDLTVAFQPDLVLELGRGHGNSTCVFTEAAQTVGCRVVSIGFDSERAWETQTAPRLAEVVDSNWFAPLAVVQGDITTIDFRPLLEGSSRTLVFWDAHGTDVAEALSVACSRASGREQGRSRRHLDDAERYGLHAEFQAGPLWSLFDELPPLWEYLAERQVELDIGDRWISFTAR